MTLKKEKKKRNKKHLVVKLSPRNLKKTQFSMASQHTSLVEEVPPALCLSDLKHNDSGVLAAPCSSSGGALSPNGGSRAVPRDVFLHLFCTNFCYIDGSGLFVDFYEMGQNLICQLDAADHRTVADASRWWGRQN